MNEFKTVQNLRFRYLIGLSLIAVLITSSWVTLQTVVAKQENFSKIINIASQQRGIAERIALFSMTMATADDPDDFATAHAQLGRAINALGKYHEMLLHGDDELGVPKVSNPVLKVLYFDKSSGLDTAVRRYITRAQAIYDKPVGELTFNSADYVFVQQYGPHVIKFMFDAAVDEYQAIGKRAIQNIQKLETLLWIVALVILVAEVIFIFRPMERKVRLALSEVLEKKSDLEKTIVELIAAKSNLSASDEKFRAMATNVPGILFQLLERRDGARDYLYVSPRCEEFYGVTPEELKNDWQALNLHPDDRERFLETIRDAFENQTEWSFEGRVLANDGTEKWCRGISTPNAVNDDETLFNGLIVDITEQKEMEGELRRLATTDPLTGAFNRRHFLELAEKEIVRTQRHRKDLSVMMIDIDHFKKINDTYGHPAGDDAIKATVDTVRDRVRGIDVVSRFGGEEFVVMLPETASGGGMILAERIRQAIEEMSVFWEDKEIRFTVSIGLTTLQPGERSLEKALKRADDGLYRAKTDGRNRVVLMDEVDRANIEELLIEA